jgi:hypothetical protein
MNWYQEPHAPPEQLIYPAEMDSDPVATLQAQDDRRLAGAECLPDLQSGGGHHDVRTRSLCPDPA